MRETGVSRVQGKDVIIIEIKTVKINSTNQRLDNLAYWYLILKLLYDVLF